MAAKQNVVDLQMVKSQMKTDSRLITILGEHYGALRTFVFQRATMEGVEAEDVLQEVFLRLTDDVELLRRVTSEEFKTRAYLYRMANNLMLDMCKRRDVRRKHKGRVEESYREEPELERQVSGQQELEVMKKVILSLKPEWRNTFLLNRFGGLSYREISKQQGISVKQVENYMIQALIRIRKARHELGLV